MRRPASCFWAFKTAFSVGLKSQVGRSAPGLRNDAVPAAAKVSIFVFLCMFFKIKTFLSEPYIEPCAKRVSRQCFSLAAPIRGVPLELYLLTRYDAKLGFVAVLSLTHSSHPFHVYFQVGIRSTPASREKALREVPILSFGKQHNRTAAFASSPKTGLLY